MKKGKAAEPQRSSAASQLSRKPGDVTTTLAGIHLRHPALVETQVSRDIMLELTLS
jgi:hypothetical protein